jgi:hypothetical protein
MDGRDRTAGSDGGARVIEQVVATSAGMLTEVDVVDGSGAVAARGVIVGRPWRIAGLPAGRYHLVVRSASGVEQVGDVGMAAATVERGEPFPVPEGAILVVSPQGSPDLESVHPRSAR